MKNLKMILIVILFGIVALMLLKISMDTSQQNLNVSFNVSSSVKIDLCENLTGIEKAKCFIDEGNLNASVDVCKNMSKENIDECFGRIAIYAADKDINKSFYMCNFSSDYFTCSTNAVAVIASKNISEAWELCNNNVQHMMCNNLVVRIAENKNESLARSLCETYSWWNDVCQCYGTIFNVIVKNNAEPTQRESKLLELCNYIPMACRDDYKIEVAKMALQYDYKKAVNICENVSSYGIEVCYLNIVSGVNKFNHTLAVEICNRINHEHEKNSCFNQI